MLLGYLYIFILSPVRSFYGHLVYGRDVEAGEYQSMASHMYAEVIDPT